VAEIPDHRAGHGLDVLIEIQREIEGRAIGRLRPEAGAPDQEKNRQNHENSGCLLVHS